MTRVAVLGDTHLPRRARDLPAGAWEVIGAADMVIHTGDVTEQTLLDRIAALRPLHAVRGNNDAALTHLPDTLLLDIDGVAVAVVHDAGPSRQRRNRLRARWPGARVVIFGHSHIPLCEDDGDHLMLNPGSPTDRRRMPTFTMAVLRTDRRAVRAEIVDLGLARA